jgi:hypothetical protein
MVRQIEHLLRELGWADGFHIPVANDENKALEEQVILISYSIFVQFNLLSLFVHPLSHTCNNGHISFSLQFKYYKTQVIMYGYPTNII